MVPTLDVCIRGAGIVGRALALLLARERLRVGLVAPAAPNGGPDVRAYALNAASKNLLESLRCWPQAPAITLVQHMRICADHNAEVNFDASAMDTSALTWIVDVPALEAQLTEAVRFQPQIELLDAPAPAALTVVCEGRASRTREEFGVDFEVTPYPQHALAARIECERSHAQIAHQWFAQGDILAFLPMGGEQAHSMSIVWSVAPEHAQRLLHASAEDFCRELEAASQHQLGQITLISERAIWPLQKAQARQWSGRNAAGAWALAGDAAHNVHPLAGQGLNLGLADVTELARLIHTREAWRGIGDERLLRRYARARKAGMLALDSGMDGLQLLFTREGAVWQALRSFGMKSVEHSGPLKHWLARQAMGL